MQVGSNDTTNPLMSLNHLANDQKMQKQPPNQRYHPVVGMCEVAMVRFTFSFLLTQSWWVQELDLREEDKLSIENGKFLNDSGISRIEANLCWNASKPI